MRTLRMRTYTHTSTQCIQRETDRHHSEQSKETEQITQIMRSSHHRCYLFPCHSSIFIQVLRRLRRGIMDSYEQSEPVKECDEENLYDSDSEEGTSALGLRRRACSDDEEDGHRRKSSYYDKDLVANKGAPPREEEEEEEEEDAIDDEDEEEDEGEESEEEEEYAEYDNEEICEIVAINKHEEQSKLHREDSGGLEGKESNKGQSEEEKKEVEPFVVPTAGAFYMHDDRFHSDGVTRPRTYNGRRNGGGRKLWEANDENHWLHDRFEELKLRDDNHYGQVLLSSLCCGTRLL
mgnify:CR=1 FL=1